MMESKSVGAFLDELASSASTPGGGGAAAMSAAMGAALVAMTANLTVGKPAYAAVEDEMQRVLSEAERLRSVATALIDDDAAAFNGVSKAYSLPRGTDDEKRARTAAIQTALKAASEPPMRVAETARAILELCPIAAEKGNKNLVSDAACGAHLALAAIEGGRLNVDINLNAIKDEAFVLSARARLNRSLDGARAIVVRTDDLVGQAG